MIAPDNKGMSGMGGLLGGAQSNNPMRDEKGGDPESKGSSGSELSSEEEIMADTAFGLTGAILYSKDASQALLQALSGNGDKTAIVGSFVAQLAMKAIEKTQETGPEISPNVWLASHGVVERLIAAAGDMAETKGGVKFGPEDQKKAFGEAVEIFKTGLHSASNGPPQGQQQPQGGPPMPQMGPPQQQQPAMGMQGGAM